MPGAAVGLLRAGELLVDREHAQEQPHERALELGQLLATTVSHERHDVGRLTAAG
jgi:hypothetical protein